MYCIQCILFNVSFPSWSFQFSGATGLPTYSVDCSNTGEGALTGPPLYISKLSQEKNITAKIEVQGVKDITSIERMVMLQPSHRVASMQVSYVTNGNKTDIQSGQDIVGAAGDSLKGLSELFYFFTLLLYMQHAERHLFTIICLANAKF